MLSLLPLFLLASVQGDEPQIDDVQIVPPPVTALAPAPSTAPPTSHRHSIAWESLPPMPYREPPEVTSAMTSFVVGEVRRGRCRPNLRGTGRLAVQVDVAVLVSAEEGARVTIPRAIDCATVEQYASGLVLGFARNNLARRASLTTQWYRATLVFEWPT